MPKEEVADTFGVGVSSVKRYVENNGYGAYVLPGDEYSSPSSHAAPEVPSAGIKRLV
jgi:hypothetical protein